MKKYKALFFVIALLSALANTAVAQQVPQSAAQMQLSFAPLVKKTSPAVVNIYTKRIVRERVAISPFFNDPFFSQFFGMPNLGGGVRERLDNALGSGVIVDPQGLVATNTHVIEGADEITVVTADGREFAAGKVLADDRSDLAILRIKPGKEKLSYLRLADSDILEVGDLVLAIGNPFGVGQTVTSGIVSAVSRTVSGPGDFGFFIQTDAAINPGNSGGALVNMQGELVGINSMIFSKSGGSLGIGFAIPANMVRTVINASRKGNKLIHPWTGLTGQPVTSDMVESLGLARVQGALITKVNPKGPAAKAGIKPGDVILSMDGRDIQDPHAMKYRLATLPIGSDVKLAVVRGGKMIELVMKTEAPLEDPPRDERKLEGNHPLSGAIVVNISPAVQEEMPNLKRDAGVVIIGGKGGNGSRMGLRIGDIVLSVNNVEVKSTKHLVKLLASRKTRRWQIQILRGDQVLNLMISL